MRFNMSSLSFPSTDYTAWVCELIRLIYLFCLLSSKRMLTLVLFTLSRMVHYAFTYVFDIFFRERFNRLWFFPKPLSLRTIVAMSFEKRNVPIFCITTTVLVLCVRVIYARRQRRRDLFYPFSPQRRVYYFYAPNINSVRAAAKGLTVQRIYKKKKKNDSVIYPMRVTESDDARAHFSPQLCTTKRYTHNASSPLCRKTRRKIFCIYSRYISDCNNYRRWYKIYGIDERSGDFAASDQCHLRQSKELPVLPLRPLKPAESLCYVHEASRVFNTHEVFTCTIILVINDGRA